MVLTAQPAFAKPKIKLDPKRVFSGKLKAGKDCRAGRTVKLIDAATGDVVARARTSRKGRFKKRSTFGGSGYAKAEKEVVLAGSENERVCSAARSEVVSHLGRVDLWLDIVKATKLDSGGVQFQLAATNLGPNHATNTAVILTSNSTFNPADAGNYGYQDSQITLDVTCTPTTNVGNQVRCAFSEPWPGGGLLGRGLGLSFGQCGSTALTVTLAATMTSDNIDLVANNNSDFESFSCR